MFLYFGVAVGFNWPATSLLTRPALLWSRLLLRDWYGAPGHPVDIAQKVQDQNPEILEFPSVFHLDAGNATRSTDQLCALGSHLLRVQLRHPSPLLQLVGQVQLCVHRFLFNTLNYPEILMHLG